MIPEPQRTYVLELFLALGAAAEDFVLAGAQAMKFTLPRARATRDFDFVLDVLSLRKIDIRLAEILRALGYHSVPEAQHFQFMKTIPNSTEVMRIEFMAPAEHRRKGDFRVEVQEGVHAHACDGGTIVLAESDPHEIRGALPNGQPATVFVRVARPHSLVMMKLMAMDERYRNVRGPRQAKHDREAARDYAADIWTFYLLNPTMRTSADSSSGSSALSPACKIKRYR